MPSFMCMPWSCNRQIDSLDRRQCNLQQIPGDIERYARSLEELLLDMNHIRDLPKSLFRMSKLQRLGLSDNDIHRLPPEVAALQNLIELNLSRNDISDLPEDLKVCQNLQLLDISSNPIARLPDSITLCTSLTQLSLNDISLTKLPQDIGKLVLLKSLEVRENHLRALPASISEFSQLQRLDLGQNELDELPNEIGSLRSLLELYVDENSLERLPDALLQCGRLEQLDMSLNRLFQLPDELGDLGCLVDLTVSHNCLRELPNSIGRLKRLFILKADDNTIDSLTPAIGGCTALNELYLQQNLIAELPSSIGNLRFLQTFNLDRCQLHRLPALIGECQSLTVLSLRDNQLEELPMEIGKLARLRVLDVCNNRIVYLPYTINVLRELQALWISENQSQALLRFQSDTDPRTGIKVLTCYLLPQESAAETKPIGNGAPPQANKAGFVGGPKVHFGGEEEHEEEMAAGTSGSANGKAAQFERKNTPHPKPSVGSTSGGAAAAAAAKHHKTKQQVDGHILPRMDEHPKQLVLNSTGKKISHDHSSLHSNTSEQPSSSSATQKQQPHPMPRSALKYSSRAIIQQQQQSQQNAEALSSSSTINQQQQRQSSEQQQKTVFFANSTGQPNTAGTETDSPGECRLKRVNTPHYKSQRAAAKSTAGQQQPQNRRQLPTIPASSDQNASSKSPCQSQTSTATNFNITQFPTDGMPIKDQQHQGKPNASAINNNNNSSSSRTESPSTTATMERKRIIVRRDPSGQSGGLGLSIAGGIESNPFIENDPGLFISKLVPGGAAEKAGVKVGDKVLEINGNSMIGRRHQVAVDSIQQRADGVELLIQRKGDQKQTTTTPSTSSTSLHQVAENLSPPNNSTMNDASTATPMPSLPISFPLAYTPNSFRTATPSQQLTNTSFSSLPATTNQQIQSKLPYAADLPYGDPKLDGQSENIHLVRDSKHSLGLSIVGGIDHCSHPFGSSANPGVFISKITTNSPAELSRRLRIGDRILKVNDADISTAKHNEAVEALKNTGRSLQLTICHEPQPKGLRSVVVHRWEQQPLGLSICGGIGSTPMNPNDRTDEGIFIERVEKGGPSDQGCVGLSIGDRILEVNDDSLLGCTKEEAAQIFRRASQGPVRLLICEGFSIDSTSTRPQMAAITVSATSPIASNRDNQNRQQNSPPNAIIGLGLINSPPMKQQNGENPHEYQNLIEIGTTPTNKNNENGNHKASEGNAPMRETPSTVKTATSPTEKINNESQQQLLKRTASIERSGVTTFSTQPRAKNPSGERNEGGSNPTAAKIPPPVAPKPRLNITSFSDQPNNDLNNSRNFSTRLRQFQQQQSAAAAIPQMLPSKRPLLSNEDLVKLAEDDRMRQLLKKNNEGGMMKENGGGRNSHDGISPMSPTVPFEHILLNESPVAPFQTVSSIRTKKAENRFLQQQQQRQNNSFSPSSAAIVDQLASEQQRRSEWRQARMASLEAESKRVGQLISDVNEITKLSLLEQRQQQTTTSAEVGENK